jgi:hypothetical protein
VGDRSGPPSQSTTSPSKFWWVRHCPAAIWGAIVLFIVPSALWRVSRSRPCSPLRAGNNERDIFLESRSRIRGVRYFRSHNPLRNV